MSIAEVKPLAIHPSIDYGLQLYMTEKENGQNPLQPGEIRRQYSLNLGMLLNLYLSFVVDYSARYVAGRYRKQTGRRTYYAGLLPQGNDVKKKYPKIMFLGAAKETLLKMMAFRRNNGNR